MLKRITKFIPKSEYMKLYAALFKSHLSYCISSWGGISEYKLQNVFSAQKRCVRFLFGKKLTFDHAGYYETCARVRSYKDQLAPKITAWNTLSQFSMKIISLTYQTCIFTKHL